MTTPVFVPAPVKPTISLKELERADLRVGTVETVEDLAKSDKFVRVTVNLGDHVRTILVGMKAERENPAEIIGRQVLVLVNRESRHMMGEASEGMLFDIGYADGVTPVLAVPETIVPNGTRAG